MSMEAMDSCDCRKCKDCCWRNPGWFGSPEEIEAAAEHIGRDVTTFCWKYLIREWWAGDEDVFIPTPRRNHKRWKADLLGMVKETWEMELQRNGEGFIVASWSHNRITGFACIFLDATELCALHPQKPLECSSVFGCKDTDFERQSLVEIWRQHQGWIMDIVEEIERCE